MMSSHTLQPPNCKSCCHGDPFPLSFFFLSLSFSFSSQAVKCGQGPKQQSERVNLHESKERRSGVSLSLCVCVYVYRPPPPLPADSPQAAVECLVYAMRGVDLHSLLTGNKWVLFAVFVIWLLKLRMLQPPSNLVSKAFEGCEICLSARCIRVTRD